MSLRKKNSKRIGRLLFFIPVIAVLALVILGLISVVLNQDGILVVATYTSDKYYSEIPLHVPVTVAGRVVTSPFNLTLLQGSYSVVYPSVKWFVTPQAKTVGLSAGKTIYAIGVYVPVVMVVSISVNGFNASSIKAMHQITPVTWVNDQSTSVVLDVSSIGRVSLHPSQNFTTVFASSGTYGFDVFNTNFSGSVAVS
jgi:hypothetical protein